MDDLDDFCELVVRGQNPEKEKIQWLFEGLIPEQGLGMILGETGTGKSLFAIHLMSCLATKSPCFLICEDKTSDSENTSKNFGVPTTKAASLYITGEGHNGVIGRIIAAEDALNEDVKSQLPLALCPQYTSEKQLPIIDYRKKTKRMRNAEQLDLLIQKIDNVLTFYEHQGYLLKLVVIDTLTSMFEIEQENNNSEMDQLMHELSALSKKLNCFILVTAHPPKSKRARQDSSRGAGGPKNSAEVVFKVKGTNGSDVRKVSIIKLREGKSEGREFTFRIKSSAGSGVMIPELSPREKKSKTQDETKLKIPDNAKQILEIIKNIEEQKRPTKDVILEELEILKPEIKRDSLKKQIDRGLPVLREKGLIRKWNNDFGLYFYTMEKDRKEYMKITKAEARKKAREEKLKEISSKVMYPPNHKY